MSTYTHIHCQSDVDISTCREGQNANVTVDGAVFFVKPKNRVFRHLDTQENLFFGMVTFLPFT